MENLAYKMEKNRQKIQIKAYLFLCIVLLLAMGFYSYVRFNEYMFVSQGAKASEKLASVLRNQIVETRAQYDDNKRVFERFDRVINQNLQKVFPASDNYTELTRQLDVFEESLARSRSPFEVSSIEYQNVVEHDDYSVLPFRMSIRSSGENFTKFLHMVENSGALDSDTRLMSVSSIRLSFQGSPTGDSPAEIINFTVQINAYFQK